MWGLRPRWRGWAGPGCGRGGVCTAERLRAGARALRHPPVPSLWVPRGGPSRPAWSYPLVLHGCSPARPARPAGTLALVPKRALPPPEPMARRALAAAAPPVSAPSLAPARRRDPHPVRQAGKCSPAPGSPLDGTPLIPHPPTCKPPAPEPGTHTVVTLVIGSDG